MKEDSNLIPLIIEKPLIPLMTKIENSTSNFCENNLPEVQSQETKLTSNNYYNDIIILDELPEYDIQDYDIFNEKHFKKYIADIEKVVRQSVEYRRFVNYLRDYMDMNKCSFLPNVTNNETFRIKIHLHHSPLTLYDIVITIFNKRVFYHESLEVEMVAKEVMYIHYFLLVGIIPLSETVHDMVHNQLIFIPVTKVMGNLDGFIEMYEEWIPPETMDKINEIKEKSLLYNEQESLSLLEVNRVILQMSDDTGPITYNSPMLEKIETAMTNRIQTIKDNNYQLPLLSQEEKTSN